MLSSLQQVAISIIILSCHAVDVERKRIMRSAKSSPQPEGSTLEDNHNNLARKHRFQTMAKQAMKKDTSNRSGVKNKLKRGKSQDTPVHGLEASADKKNKITHAEKEVSKESWKADSVHPPRSRQHVELFAGGEHSRLDTNGISAAGPANLAEIPPSTSPTAFIIQSSGAVDVSGNVAASSSSIHLDTSALVAIQQAPAQPAPATPGAPVPTAPTGVAAAPPQVPPQGAVPGTPAATPAGAPSTNSTAQTQAEGGSSFLWTFFMLLLVVTVVAAGAAMFIKFRKERNGGSSRGGRLAGLLTDEPGDSQFWKSAKTRQSKSRGSQFGSETEEETKSEETEDKRKGSAYRDRRRESSRIKGEGEDSEADMSKSAYKKSRSRAQSETPKVDKKTSDDGDTGGSKRQSVEDTPAVTSYRGRRNQLSSRSDSRSTSRSQSISAKNDEEPNEIAV